MLVPLYGFVQGDTMGLLVLAHDDMLIADLAKKLKESASIRVDTENGEFRLYAGERALESYKTVREYGLSALDRIDLRRGAGP